MQNNIIPSVHEWQLIWSNPNPTTAFAAQTINLDLSKYNYIRVEHRLSTSDSRGQYVDVLISDVFFYLLQFGTAIIGTNTTSGMNYVYTREGQVTPTGITFSTGYRKDNLKSDAPVKGTNYVIPTRIWAC